MTDRVRRCECGERISYVQDVHRCGHPPSGRLIHIDANDQETDRGHAVVEAVTVTA